MCVYGLDGKRRFHAAVLVLRMHGEWISLHECAYVYSKLWVISVSQSTSLQDLRNQINEVKKEGVVAFAVIGRPKRISRFQKRIRFLGTNTSAPPRIVLAVLPPVKNEVPFVRKIEYSPILGAESHQIEDLNYAPHY